MSFGLEVCLSPALLPSYTLAGKTVVVTDVLRATSTMSVILQQGAECIVPVTTVEEARNLGKKGWLAAAERNGQKAEGFHYGNSPFDYLGHNLIGCKLVMTTTNGTRALAAAANAADHVLCGAFVNLHAVADAVKSLGKDCLVLCAGWKDNFNIEDSLFAGALAKALAPDFSLRCDAGLAVSGLWSIAQDDLFGYIKASSHFNRLERLHIEEDVRFCMTLNSQQAVPVLENDALIAWKSSNDSTR